MYVLSLCDHSTSTPDKQLNRQVLVYTFQIVLEDTCTSNHFSGISKNQNCCCLQINKKSKLCHKIIIFISLESSCVTLQNVHSVHSAEQITKSEVCAQSLFSVVSTGPT